MFYGAENVCSGCLEYISRINYYILQLCVCVCETGLQCVMKRRMMFLDFLMNLSFLFFFPPPPFCCPSSALPHPPPPLSHSLWVLLSESLSLSLSLFSLSPQLSVSLSLTPLVSLYSLSLSCMHTSTHTHTHTQRNAAQRNTTQHNTTQHNSNTTQHNTTQHNTHTHTPFCFFPSSPITWYDLIRNFILPQGVCVMQAIDVSWWFYFCDVFQHGRCVPKFLNVKLLQSF